MKFTPEMIAQDEKTWHARDILTELTYCSANMRDRNRMRNWDIRYYAYLMRKAAEMLREKDAEIQRLKGTHITATGNGVAIGEIHGGLTIKRG